MTDLPIHKVTDVSDYGIFLKTITSSSAKERVRYSHRDDYYIFGFICSLSIDYKAYPISKGGTIFIQPSQIHHFISSTNLKASILIMDSAFIDEAVKNIFDEYTLHLSPFQLNG